MPEIQNFLDITELDGCDSPKKQKEVMPSFFKKYIGDCQVVYQKFATNPVLKKEPTKINSNTVMPQCIVEDMGKVVVIGALQ